MKKLGRVFVFTWLMALLTLSGCSGLVGNQIYQDPDGFFSVSLPRNWRQVAPSTFSPFSLNDDISKTMLQIIVKPTAFSRLSEREKNSILIQKVKMTDVVASQESVQIQKLNAWLVNGETKAFGPLRKTSEIYFVYKKRIFILSLISAPEVFNSTNQKFKGIIASFKVLK